MSRILYQVIFLLLNTISRCSNFIFTLIVRCRDANILIVGWNIADYVIEDEKYNRVRGRAFNVKVTLAERIKYFEHLLIISRTYRNHIPQKFPH